MCSAARLLFVLRGVNESDLVAGASDGLSLPDARPAAAILDGDVAALFGLEMADEPAASPAAADAKIVRNRSPKTAKRGLTHESVRRRVSAKQKTEPRATTVPKGRQPRRGSAS